MNTREVVVAGILLLAIVGLLRAQEATLVETAAKTIFERMVNVGGEDAAAALEKAGGQAAVKAVLVDAEKEGGDALVRQIAAYATRYGPSAIDAIKPNPALIVGALKQLPAKLVGPAIRAAAREPTATETLVKTFGKDALEVEACQPGVGSTLMQKLGPDDVRLGKALSTDDAIVVTRSADDIATLSAPQRAALIGSISANPLPILAYLEKHPGILHTVGGALTVLSAKDDLLGKPAMPGNEGFLERFSYGMLDRLHTPIAAITSIFCVGLTAWFAVHIWATWKNK